MKKSLTAMFTAAAIMGTSMVAPNQAAAMPWVVVPIAIVGTIVLGTAAVKAGQPKGTITVKAVKRKRGKRH